MNQKNQSRILATSLSWFGVGYAVLEEKRGLIEFGSKRFREEKNVRALAEIDKMIFRYRPDVLVLEKVNGKNFNHGTRIKALHREVLQLAKRRKIPVAEISKVEVWNVILGKTEGTKQTVAEMVAKRFPEELASRLPPPRQLWQSEDGRMGIFEATALALAHQAAYLPKRAGKYTVNCREDNSRIEQ